MTPTESENLIQLITQAVLRTLGSNADDRQAQTDESALNQPKPVGAAKKFVLPCGHEFRSQANSSAPLSAPPAAPDNATDWVTAIFTKRLVSEADILSALKQNQRRLVLSAKTILTPLAQDCCKQHGVTISYQSEMPAQAAAGVRSLAAKKVLILAPASNHSQIVAVSEAVTAAGLEPERWPAPSASFRIQAALAELSEHIGAGLSAYGIVIHENVFQLCLQANRRPGVHGVVGWDLSAVQMSQTNLLFLNQRQFGLKMLQKLVLAWLTRSSRQD